MGVPPVTVTKQRCDWAREPSIMTAYHDTEWGVPLHDDRKLFEFLILEGAQAGLSWLTVLKKRAGYRRAFDGFDPEKVARYRQPKINQLMQNEGIIRNKLKIEAAVSNAQAFLAIQKEFGSFQKFIWGFVDGKPLLGARKQMKSLPTTTQESDEMSKGLKRRRFRFVGSTICYAHMQATGMVNDHLTRCFRYRELLPKQTKS